MLDSLHRHVGPTTFDTDVKLLLKVFIFIFNFICRIRLRSKQHDPITMYVRSSSSHFFSDLASSFLADSFGFGFGFPFHSSFRGVMNCLMTSSVTSFLRSWNSLTYCWISSMAIFFSSPVSSSPRR